MDTNTMATSDRVPRRPRVVIVGCGFGGLAVARGLKRSGLALTILDRSNHHLFQPLLYQVATAALNPADIASPIRRILRSQAYTEVLLAEVTGFDLDDRRVILADGEVPFDYLVVATGATHSYFGNDRWATFAPGLKSIDDALQLRKRILSAFEFAERELDPKRRRAWLTFVVVGGGPTGVEMAGTLAEVARKTLASDFTHIDPTEARVLLVEGSPKVLGAFGGDLPDRALAQLEHLGVEVWTGRHVTEIDADGVTIAETRVEARTVIWAAGVTASPLGKKLGVPIDRAGRVEVNPDLTIPGHDDVYVIGDLAHVVQDGKPVPGIAPAATQMGKCVAANIRRTARGQSRRAFRYFDKGTLATIGRGAAIAQFGRVKLSGFFAWLLWLFVHIFFLIGFRNRLIVMLQWAWSFFTFDRGARLITGKIKWPNGPTAPLAPPAASEPIPTTVHAENVPTVAEVAGASRG
jgi:NADH dehydrogenase